MCVSSSQAFNCPPPPPLLPLPMQGSHSESPPVVAGVSSGGNIGDLLFEAMEDTPPRPPPPASPAPRSPELRVEAHLSGAGDSRRAEEGHTTPVPWQSPTSRSRSWEISRSRCCLTRILMMTRGGPMWRVAEREGVGHWAWSARHGVL